MIVDPDGNDDYYFDANGRLSMTSDNGSQNHRFYVWDYFKPYGSRDQVRKVRIGVPMPIKLSTLDYVMVLGKALHNRPDLYEELTTNVDQKLASDLWMARYMYHRSEAGNVAFQSMIIGTGGLLFMQFAGPILYMLAEGLAEEAVGIDINPIDPGSLIKRQIKKQALSRVEMSAAKQSIKQLPVARTAVQTKAQPGVAFGSGKSVSGGWLKGTNGNAGVVPSSIAEKMSGGSYKNWDDFRESFWIEVAKSKELAGQFSKSNQKRMARGRAPKAVKGQWLGKRGSYELHHRTPVNEGGAVFDMDNLMIVSPRGHKEVLDPDYHY